ncbi:MAG: DUF4854 domain-containing protein [Lachnospiraceae bacterium]|nr:DUF4854 domain-containing protein [Lachnospiraceae bacterium]
MKRKTLKLFAGMLSMTVLLSITACGSLDETKKASVTSITEYAGDETEAETKTETESTENEAQAKAESQDRTEKQAETKPQDKTEKQAETEPQDKADKQAEAEPQDKADKQAEAEPQDKAETQSKMETQTEPEKEKTKDTEGGTADNAKQYETLEDYFKDPETKNAFDKQIAVSSSDDLTISYDVKGNELACVIKFANNSIIGANVDDIKAALDAGLEAQADSFKELAKKLDETIGKERACTIIVRYTDSDGNVFAEKAFKAD